MLNVVGCYAECLALGSFMVKSTLLLVSTRSYVITGSNKNWTEKNKESIWRQCDQEKHSLQQQNLLRSNNIEQDKIRFLHVLHSICRYLKNSVGCF